MLLVCKLKRLAAVATSLCVYIFEYYAQLRYPRLSESRVAPPPCIDHLYHIVCILLVYVCKDNAFLLICKSFARYFLKMKYFTVKYALSVMRRRVHNYMGKTWSHTEAVQSAMVVYYVDRIEKYTVFARFGQVDGNQE